MHNSVKLCDYLVDVDDPDDAGGGGVDAYARESERVRRAGDGDQQVVVVVKQHLDGVQLCEAIHERNIRAKCLEGPKCVKKCYIVNRCTS